MGRVLRGLGFILVASLLVTAATGRFRFLDVLGWAFFFTWLYWSSLRNDRRRGCRI